MSPISRMRQKRTFRKAVRDVFNNTTSIKRESTGGATVLQPMLTTWISILVLLAAIIKGLEYLEMTSTAWSTNGE
ncbi:hypothetical protein CSKR_200332 [Clonorchis sinensis]|uniref:Uncharacterized protein n=1 Tax=Clonorchis sinensis TaxID=79923 RepID=A0A8T1MCZ7_CLOSI|nr:hypothetical protein CSKR_200332 [Clonorchis sinensis]